MRSTFGGENDPLTFEPIEVIADPLEIPYGALILAGLLLLAAIMYKG